MFDALDLLFVKLGDNKSIDRNGDDIPELNIQKEYLNLLKLTA
jgi:hypothetical protein